MIVDGVTRALVDDLVASSARFIDRDEIEAWLDCFDEDGRYVVIPRENHARGYPIALIHCDTKARIKDRVVCLRHANKFNPHHDRHVVGAPCILGLADGIATAESSFMVVQTTETGVSRLFCAGSYQDRIRVKADRARFVERVVVLDSFSVPTLLATPL